MPHSGNLASSPRYLARVTLLLAALQFTIILDFMIVSPLGAILMPELSIAPSQFGVMVSAYAFSAGLVGFVAAGYSDRFDRKRLLFFFYGGFVVGNLLCAIAPSFPFLLAGRVVTGLFGGVVGSILLTMVADLFPIEQRGRVMGIIQTAFSVSQVAGIPTGLYLATHLGWHAPFAAMTALGALLVCAIAFGLRPMREHLGHPRSSNPFVHLAGTVGRGDYLMAFGATTLLATGGFMIMPFASAFAVENLKIPLERIPVIYTAVGLFTMVGGPMAGRLSDSVGKVPLFAGGTALAMGLVVYYCRLGPTPLWWVVALNVVLFIGLTARMVSAQALMTAVPELKDRGAFMSVNAAVAQFSGGMASAVAGLIVSRGATGEILHFDVIGYVVAGTMAASILLVGAISRRIQKKSASAALGGPEKPLSSR